MDVDVPVLGLGGPTTRPSTERALAARLDDAWRSSGFVVLTDHGVDAALTESLDAAARTFFRLPVDDKLAVRSAAPGARRGFTPSGDTALGTTEDERRPPDLCEVFSISRFDDRAAAVRAGYRPGREAFFAPNVWPPVPVGFTESLRSYYAAMEVLAQRIMRLSAVALGLDPHWFDDKIADHITSLGINYYPHVDGAVLPGQLRRGAHTDWGTITILRHDGRPGLQIETGDGEWLDAPVVPDSFVVNVGDLLARWTNDRWRSTMHRVVNPPDGTDDERVSIAFFHQPGFDVRVETLPTCVDDEHPNRYAPVTSGEWLARKVALAIG
jgi:isopenicillin N synthase-like dioxygenase